MHNLYSSIIKKVSRCDKNGEEFTENTFCMLHFIDSQRLMASSSSNLLDGLFEGIYRIKVNWDMTMRNVRLVE